MPSQAQAGAITLRVSVADRCALRCLYCNPADTPRTAAASSAFPFEHAVRVVEACQRFAGSVRVRVTGGEPLERRGIVRLISMLRERAVSDLALTTNGVALAAMAGLLADAGLMRVNISLDSLDPVAFARIAGRDHVRHVIAGIGAAREAGLTPIKLNCVVLRGINDAEICSLTTFAGENGCEMRFIELMPIGPAAREHGRRFVPAAEILARVEERYDVTPEVDAAATTARYMLARCKETGREVRVGLIAPMSHPFCLGCDRLRLTSRGELLSCLKEAAGTFLPPLMDRPDTDELIERAIARALQRKAGCGMDHPARAMVAVGG